MTPREELLAFFERRERATQRSTPTLGQAISEHEERALDGHPQFDPFAGSHLEPVDHDEMIIAAFWEAYPDAICIELMRSKISQRARGTKRRRPIEILEVAITFEDHHVELVEANSDRELVHKAAQRQR